MRWPAVPVRNLLSLLSLARLLIAIPCLSISLSGQVTAKLSGEVVDDTGRPVANAEVVAAMGSPLALASFKDRLEYRVRTSATGSYSLDVPPATWYLRALPDTLRHQPDGEIGWPGPALKPSSYGLPAGMAVNGALVPLPLPTKQPRQATALVPTFYPRFDDPARALAIVVKDAAPKSHLKIYLQRKPLYSVECEWQLPKDLSWNGTGYIAVEREPTIDVHESRPIIEIKRSDKSVLIDGLIPGVYGLTATIWQWHQQDDTSPEPPHISGSVTVTVTDRDLKGIAIDFRP